MKIIKLFTLLISVLLIGSCVDKREFCKSQNYYPNLNLNDLKSDGKVKREGLFELLVEGDRLVNYKWLNGDTLEMDPFTSFESKYISYYAYIDSLNEIGGVFEINLAQNWITENANEPAIRETASIWYFVEFEDENRRANDLVEAIIPIDNKTEAYVAAVSSIEGFDAFWYQNSEIIESKITEQGDDYLLHITYNETYCDPHKLGELDVMIKREGVATVVKDYGITKEIDCKCD